jgi:hypothetical protein
MDHKNLTFANFNTDCVCRWGLIVEEYGPEIAYLPGVHNIVADFLSRLIQSLPTLSTRFTALMKSLLSTITIPSLWTSQQSAAINKQTFAFNESNNPTMTMKLASSVALR